MRIEDQVVLVTGAASGLGLATASHLQALEARVVAVDRDEEALARLADAVPSISTVSADITDPEDVARAISSAQRIGPLGSVVNCAGGGLPPSRTLSRSGEIPDLDDWRGVVDLNLVAAFDISRQAARAMSRQDAGDGTRGVIVHVSSIAALDGSLGVSAYSATKGALPPLVHTMARDLAPWGIRVMAIAPGVFDTPMYARLPEQVRERRLQDFVFPARPGEPDEFARLVQHVIENEYLNGDCIRIDGGMRMHK